MAISFSITLFISAFLLFSAQPMIGKMVLPRFGGTPAVWNTCMLFFQVLLLIGYAYAHGVTRWLTVRWQKWVHLGVVLVPGALLPFVFPETFMSSMPGGTPPILLLLGLLTVTAGLPVFVVSTTSPLMQKWFAATRAGADPYFLYAASNLGSMIGLLGYPFVVEPLLPLLRQSQFWGLGYGILAVLVLSCVFFLVPGEEKKREALAPVNRRDSVRWVLFAFVPSSLMLGLTTYLTTDIAPIPLLWVLPLAAYLLTFIFAFARRPLFCDERARLALGRIFCMCAAVLIAAYVLGGNHPILALMTLNGVLFFCAAMLFHGALARERPSADQLTHFYLCLSIGGVLGGVFNALLAPLIFNGVLEYPLVILLACAIRPTDSSMDFRGDSRRDPLRRADFLWVLGIGSLTWALVFTPVPILLSIPVLLTYRFVRSPARFSLCLAAFLAAGLQYREVNEKLLFQKRNFYGVLRVSADRDGKFVELTHGNTVHGRQNRIAGQRAEPISYYDRTGPVGDLFERVVPGVRPSAVAVIGLGSGAMAAYAGKSQDWTFYEIDPDIEKIARNPALFTYLADEQARSLQVVPGDARLRLAEARDRQYGLVVLDAFSSDAIPTHLLTREALALYLAKLEMGGVLAFHVTNRMLNLAPLVSRLAHEAGLVAFVRSDIRLSEEEKKRGKSASIWVVMARQQEVLAPLASLPQWRPLALVPGDGWTDDYSDIARLILWKN